MDNGHQASGVREPKMKYLLITGASAGIGLSTAKLFLDSDYKVINLSRRPCPDERTIHMRADLTDPNFYSLIEADIKKHLSQAEEIVLVHNAAKLTNDNARSTESKSLREILEINIVAPNTLNLAILPFMQGGSSIIYLGSTLSEKAVPNSFSYVTSKHAVIGMMRSTCQDLVASDIHTACICPGFTDTEMLREHVPDEFMEQIKNMSSFGRLVEPEEIANTIFWASQNRVINGSVIHANLGQIES
jgi:NAD(P)-dependent dehydrogenase (short-subunit alcohol dehydrogenase family)